MHARKIGLHLLSMFALFSSPALLLSCAGPKISAPNATPCTVAGRLFLGSDCAETNTGKNFSLSYQEEIDFLEPQKERTCVPVPGIPVCADDQAHGTPVKLAARAGAIQISDQDYTAQKDAFEQACVELKDRCTPELRAAFYTPFENVHVMLRRAQKKKTPSVSDGVLPPNRASDALAL